MARIDHWHTQMPGIGARKLVVQLKNEGFAVGRKLVRRLMDEMGIQAIYPKANLSKRNFRESVVPYLLRNKEVFFPNQVWSIDIQRIQGTSEGTAHPSEHGRQVTLGGQCDD